MKEYFQIEIYDIDPPDVVYDYLPYLEPSNINFGKE
jgi:hypothetical protein